MIATIALIATLGLAGVFFGKPAKVTESDTFSGSRGAAAGHQLQSKTGEALAKTNGGAGQGGLADW